VLTRKRTVLIVEDHPQLRASLRRCFTENAFQVEAAGDYHGAIKVLEAVTPHLVCLDLTLPRESGFELCEHIRGSKHLHFVPILVISDRVSPEDMAHAEEVGANAFLKKPFTPDRLMKYVTALLDGPHASRPSVRRLRRSEPPPG
jgi:DNA-binding response OmpR family regulator